MKLGKGHIGWNKREVVRENEGGYIGYMIIIYCIYV